MTLKEYIIGVQQKTIDPKVTLDQINQLIDNDTHNCWIQKIPEIAQQQLEAAMDLPLAGAAIGVKDLIMTEGIRTTCGSKMLENYIPPYSATCYQKLIAAGGVLVGKNNLDQFAMGGSGENSAFGPTQNPYDITRISGGSSSGSAASVALGQCLGSLGTDTGGSVRQPAAFCGVVGMKPTYGRVSRYGVQPMANSLDQVGVITKTIDDAQILLQAISGYDSLDATSQEKTDHLDWSVDASRAKNLKIACIKQCFDGLDPVIESQTHQIIKQLQEAGVTVEWIDLETIKLVVAIYYILCPAEVSTNMARFDGIRYGLQHNTGDFKSLNDYYDFVRSEGSGDEVKRRILIGTYVLSAGYYDAYYAKAIQAREVLRSEFDKIFSQFDVVLSPTSPVMPRKIGGHSDNPLADYLADLETIPANLLGCPAASVPGGMVEFEGSKLPVGVHLMAQRWNEQAIFDMGKLIEEIQRY